MQKRHFLKSISALGLFSIVNKSNLISADGVVSPATPMFAPTDQYTLPALDYAFNALEPNIDARTMEIHHDKHHNGYVTNLNKELSPKPTMAPTGDLSTAINTTFKDLATLKDLMNKAGAGRFGSGWAWLVADAKGKLSVGSTPNQDNPLMDVSEIKGYPLLGIDVWEHAYYLKYQNKRADYLTAIWNVINWDEVAKRYAEAKSMMMKK